MFFFLNFFNIAGLQILHLSPTKPSDFILNFVPMMTYVNQSFLYFIYFIYLKLPVDAGQRGSILFGSSMSTARPSTRM